MLSLKWAGRLIHSPRFTTWRKVATFFGLTSNDDLIPISGSGQYIYRLIDPRTLKTFYVGRSNNPGRRYTEHVNEPAGTDKDKRISRIKRHRGMPYMVVLEQCGSDNVHERERYWIKYFGGVKRLENMKQG